ncbi:glutamate synthase (NADPH) large subunit [Litorimonas taeanensis]|uniref:Glutamate synthase [NADPH] large chain n=1 Tax=Litorimonas taeanensis TaxID=568099 RepID=A0A420WKX3_9PROT|nr:glutamate synthase large subunit [Litorimonas taeanensis]RKQ71664.1 glutamate synthase (NADPH) large subunit [Litorimonas taeanensis]
MTDWLTDYETKRDALIAANAYDPEHERANCGVGLVASIDGTPRRDVVEKSIQALKNVWHRGAVDADGKTGDGAGIRLDIPQEFFRAQVEETGHKASSAKIAVGMIFLPRTDFNAQEAARTIVESELLKEGFYIYGWRQVPINIDIIGEKAKATRPAIEQVLFRDPKGRKGNALERELYIVRRRIEKRVIDEAIPSFYVCSLSVQTLIYKGMFLAQDIDNFYTDLKDERFISRAAIYHQRYSTNTFPQWWLAQPFRMLAHNGEINTLKANRNLMKSHEIKMANSVFAERAADVKPIIQKGSSDSAALDAVFELLVRAGRSAPMAKTLLVPEAYSKRGDLMPESWRALYEYCNAVMEPWDGPAALAAYDGRWVMAGLDRNGLRPLRYSITSSGILAVGSEAGMCPLDERDIIKKGALRPGRMIAVDLEEGKFYTSTEIMNELAEKRPYKKWLKKVVNLDDTLAGPEPAPSLSGEGLVRRQMSCGQTLEDQELILSPMGETGKESIGSMGDDTPLAVLSDIYRPLSHYFRQNFSQVTNPPIDPLRETRVMGLKTRFRNLRNILAETGSQTREMYVLDSPVLTNGMFERFAEMVGSKKIAMLDCTFPVADTEDSSGRALRDTLRRIREEAVAAVKKGVENIVLTDENTNEDRAAAPIILCTGAVQTALVNEGLRASCSILVRSAECMDTHYFAVLIGAGATAVNAYMAQDSLVERVNRGLLDMNSDEAVAQYKAAIEGGLLKIISKMGISVISSYRGGNNFEAIGLSRALVGANFPGMASRISGIGLAGLEAKILEMHERAYDPAVVRLPIGGLYRVRAKGERHAYQADMIHMLQEAVSREDYELYKNYAKVVNTAKPIQIRDLLALKPSAKPIPLHRVQSVNEIRRRFCTPGMSLGALSPEAHGTLNIAMNRIGAKSVSGEGGEDRARYKPLPNGDNPNSAVKQIASGRFGVNAEYLNKCREIEIKVAQGAKPGEGGQLPGFKVTEMIAKFRNATPGVTLISPPPHHDIYSIEDLAQLIYDLKQINPTARVAVKLVASSGVGTIAAGVAKAKADTILIAGHNGGTGASPNTSLKYAGLPWELGLSEAHQVLTLNNLRGAVTLRTDGGLKTGRDIVIAALLGAEEYGIGTLSLVAMGCIMVRQCHSNTCPVGVCVQDPALREKFTGSPEKVINLMTFIAEEVREILAELGVETLDEIIGRTDLLTQVSRGAENLDDLDLNPILAKIDNDRVKDTRNTRIEVPDTLDVQIVADAQPFFESGEKTYLTYGVQNTHRAVGTRTSSHIYNTFGIEGAADGQLTVRLRGSAGQSLGAFGMKGLRICVDGDANDYVGKGLSGAEIIVAPQGHTKIDTHNSAIIGNTCLYGATKGMLLAAGRAGERFCVRNSGAVTVVEGCGSNGCEYMTGGIAVILGPVGDNFGAGMTGGMAYIYDVGAQFEKAINPDNVICQRFSSEYYEEECKDLIRKHAEMTGSEFSKKLLDEWELERGHFWQVVPKEMLTRLAVPLVDAAE